MSVEENNLVVEKPLPSEIPTLESAAGQLKSPILREGFKTLIEELMDDPMNVVSWHLLRKCGICQNALKLYNSALTSLNSSVRIVRNFTSPDFTSDDFSFARIRA